MAVRPTICHLGCLLCVLFEMMYCVEHIVLHLVGQPIGRQCETVETPPHDKFNTICHLGWQSIFMYGLVVKIGYHSRLIIC